MELLGFFNIFVTGSVLNELTRKNRQGADTFKSAAFREMVRVIAAENIPDQCITSQGLADFLDQGELDTIKCFGAGGMDLIITDDGRAARYCKKNELPFINALLFPRLLFYADHISLQESTCKMDDIIRMGRYSAGVIEWARKCRKEDLAFALS